MLRLLASTCPPASDRDPRWRHLIPEEGNLYSEAKKLLITEKNITLEYEQEGTVPVRFRQIIVSVRFGLAIPFSDSMRFGLRLLNASWLGPVRFGSFPRPVPAGSRIKRFGSTHGPCLSRRAVRRGDCFEKPQPYSCTCSMPVLYLCCGHCYF